MDRSHDSSSHSSPVGHAALLYRMSVVRSNDERCSGMATGNMLTLEIDDWLTRTVIAQGQENLKHNTRDQIRKYLSILYNIKYLVIFFYKNEHNRRWKAFPRVASLPGA